MAGPCNCANSVTTGIIRAKALEAIAEEMGLAQRYEPRRLLKAKEYRAAVIAKAAG